MKMRAAIAFAAGKPLEAIGVDLEGPKAGEVLVELKATGVCRNHASSLPGDDLEGAFPAILGHDGAGFGGAGPTPARIVDWFMDGKADIDDLSHTMPLDELNTAFDPMHKGKSIRPVVIY